MKLYLNIFAIFTMSFLYSGDWIGVTSDVNSEAEIILEESNIESSILTFKTSGYIIEEVQTQRGISSIISIDEGTPILEQGYPDIPKLTSSVIIPNLGEMSISIIDSEYSDYENINIAPSKGNLFRNVDPSTIDYQYGLQYEVDDFYPGVLADLRDPYIARDFRGQTIIAYPFQYNPVKKTLRVYHTITVKVENIGGNGINEKVFSRSELNIKKEYNGIYQEHFENYNNVDRYDVLSDQGNMLIICYDSFMDEMEPFVDWKRMKGMSTEIIAVSDIGGSSSAIESFVEDFYYSEGLTFLLLVGDINQIPSPSVGGSASDPTYGFIEGADSYPEVIVGRFSAENSAHVETQVERTINYERYPVASGDWYTTSLGVASNQGPGDDNEDDCQHVSNINNILEDYNYNESSEICDPSGSVSQGVNAINSGVSVINYTGHGSQTSWGNGAQLSNSDVNGLNNTDKLPFIWSVACVNGEFHTGTCFAETWLRATHNNQPSGAIGFFGSTVNQSWSPPMEGQDEMNDILVETYNNNIKRTYGGLSANGCMKMNDSYGSSGEYETNYWTLFGDPSVEVRTAEPSNINVDHPDFIMIGSESLEVSTGVQGALVALSSDGELIGSSYAGNSGVAVIGFDEPIMNGGEMKLVVTAYNHFPYEVDIMAMSPEGAYVVVENTMMDEDMNGNDMVDWGETVSMHIIASNIGVDLASNVTAQASSSDPHLFNLDGIVNFSNINPDGTSMSDSPISFSVQSDVPEGHSATIDVTFSDDSNNEWESSFNVMIHHNCGVADVNTDGILNVLDIVRVVNMIVNAGDPSTEFEECASDVSGDGNTNILDVINIINMVLDEDRPIYGNVANSAKILISKNSLNVVSNDPIAGVQISIKANNLVLNPDIDMDVKLNKSNDNYDILIYSMQGKTISGNTPIFLVDDQFEIASIVLANTDAEEVDVSYDFVPQQFTLNQNHPNPFNPVTNIDFSIQKESYVTLKVINLLGKEVQTLVSGYQPVGFYSVKWDGKTSSGNLAPSGIYIYQLNSIEGTLSRKMVLMK